MWKLDEAIYNRLIFQYILHVLLGCILYKYKDKIINSAVPLISIIMGVIYIVNVHYRNYSPVLAVDTVTRKSFGLLYSFGLICYLLRLEDRAIIHASVMKPIAYIGKASYHILLSQMVYFYFARYFHIEEMIGSLAVIILFDLTMGLTSGCLFYAVESEIKGWITGEKQRIKENEN